MRERGELSQSVMAKARSGNNASWVSEVNSPRLATQQFSVLTVSKTKGGLHIMIYEGKDGWFVARCLELSAAISQGKTREEATRNIEEAISLVLEDMEILELSSSNLKSQWSHV